MKLNSLICKIFEQDENNDVTVEKIAKLLFKAITTTIMVSLSILSIFLLLCIYINGLRLAYEYNEDMIRYPFDIMSMLISLAVTGAIVLILLLIIWGAIKDKTVAHCPVKKEEDNKK